MITGSLTTPSSLIFNTFLVGTGVNSFLTKVSALRNLSNILPLPNDLLKVFDTITNFGNKVIGITNAFSQVTSDVENIFQNTSSLFKTIQSGFQTNVASIASTSSRSLPTRPGQQTSGQQPRRPVTSRPTSRPQ
jgi:phage-related protein